MIMNDGVSLEHFHTPPCALVPCRNIQLLNFNDYSAIVAGPTGLQTQSRWRPL